MTVPLNPSRAGPLPAPITLSRVEVGPGAGESLQFERNFLSTVIDHMDTLLVVLDQHGRIIRFNRACERLFGYTTDEIRSKLGTGALPLPKEISAIKVLLIQIKTRKNFDSYESEWVNSAGEAHTISWTISVLHGDRGEIEYIFATGADITRRKLAEKMLERQRALLQGLIDSIPDLVFYKDCAGSYLGCNTAFERFRGCQQNDIVGKNDGSIYPAELAAHFNQTDQEVIQKREQLVYENWTTHPDGQPILIETRKTPYYGPQGEVLGVIGVGRDITRHRRVEDALREAKLEIEHLIASLSSILIVLTEDLRVARWNPMAQKIFGVEAGEVLDRRLNELGLKWEWAPIAAALGQCREDGRSVYLPPVRLKRPDESDGYLGLNISPIYDQHSRLAGYILLGSDITERKILENRLVQAQKLESIGQLAAGIAHEINTPIQYIGNNTSFLEDSFNHLLKLSKAYDGLLTEAKAGRVDPGQVAAIESMRAGADLDYLYGEIPTAIRQTLDGIGRVSEIVCAMKEFSHPGVKEKRLVDINQAIENSLIVTKNEWKYVAAVETDLQPSLPMVMCLPGEINQVLLNLIVNAAQAIDSAMAGGQKQAGKIAIQTRAMGEWVEIRIGDNGSGIPEEIRCRIFEPFFTTKEVGKGTGQGLAIAYDVIVRKHEGSLDFYSEVGRGTTFIVRLPVQPVTTGPGSAARRA